MEISAAGFELLFEVSDMAADWRRFPSLNRRRRRRSAIGSPCPVTVTTFSVVNGVVPLFDVLNSGSFPSVPQRMEKP